MNVERSLGRIIIEATRLTRRVAEHRVHLTEISTYPTLETKSLDHVIVEFTNEQYERLTK